MKLLTLLSFILLMLISCSKEPNIIERTNTPELKQRTLAQKSATVFSPFNSSSLTAPKITEIPFSYANNVDAIWGALGRDDAGNIYFGASTHGGEYGTAYLYQYNPVTDQVTPQSDVVTQLKMNGEYEPDARQNKLHSKFYEADDGYLYFSSFDESGESEGVNPYWGGHLWRKKPNDENWEHLLATEEALIAVNTNGRYVYALGYWDHVLYQFDVMTKKVKRIVVGSIGQHITRNFLVDINGHAFVPELSLNEYNETSVSLIELDTNLNIVGRYPMPSYKAENIRHHHGIVGYTSLANGDVYFTTWDNGFYKISINESGPSKLKYLNTFTDTKQYSPSIYPIPGTEMIGGLYKKDKSNYSWLIYQADMNIKESVPVELPEGLRRAFFWGTLTKDDLGNYYAVGWSDSDHSRRGMEPIIVKLTPSE